MIKLPIFMNKKKIDILFKVTKKENNIIIKPVNNSTNLIDVCCFYKNSIMKKKIFFPLEFKIIDKNIYSEYFFFTSQINGIEFDFFRLLLITINDIF